VSRWIVAGVALLAAALAAWMLLRAPGPEDPHADIDEADRQRLLEILREEEG
jgi:hypothetical protein